MGSEMCIRDSAWISVGCLNPSDSHASHSGAITPRSANERAPSVSVMEKMSSARASSRQPIMPPVWEQWRQDFNNRLDKVGEDHLKLPSALPGKSKSGTYEERLARARSGGGAAGTQAASLGLEPRKPRNVPPPPPGSSGIPPPSNAAAAPPLHPAGSAPTLPARSDPLPTYTPPAGVNLQFSRFTENDKREFFQLLDEVRLC